jgi:hypothetical protein
MGVVGRHTCHASHDRRQDFRARANKPSGSLINLSQTDGNPVPSASYQLPTSDGPAGVLDQLAGWLIAGGWTVKETPLAGGCEGYSDHPRHVIVTDAGLAPAARLTVLLHEAAHAVLHGELAPGEYQAHGGLCETEAESVAYVLANLLGLDTDASSISYIAGWSHTDPAVIAAAATNVLRAVNTIGAGLGLDNQNDDDAAGEHTAA